MLASGQKNMTRDPGYYIEEEEVVEEEDQDISEEIKKFQSSSSEEVEASSIENWSDKVHKAADVARRKSKMEKKERKKTKK